MPEAGFAARTRIKGSRYDELTTFTLYSTRSFQEFLAYQGERLSSVLPESSVTIPLFKHLSPMPRRSKPEFDNPSILGYRSPRVAVSTFNLASLHLTALTRIASLRQHTGIMAAVADGSETPL
jgi:hypothetical protein